MGRKYKIKNQREIYFVTFTVVLWLDVFTRERYKNIIVDSLTYCQKEKGLEIYAWVIMTNHIHLIIGSKGTFKIENIIRDFKTYTSKKIVKEIKLSENESRKELLLNNFLKVGKENYKNVNYQFWQQNYHPIELSNDKIMNQRLEYLHSNPVKAGFVEENGDWLYSSARDYEKEQKGLIDINFLH